MKKIFFLAFVAFLFFTPFVSASATIAWSPDAISGLGDLGYSLIGGASFDFKNSKYIEGAVDVDDALAEQQAAQFLADYCLSRGIGLLNPDELPTSDYEYFKTYYFNSITNKAWNNYRLAQTQAEQDEALRFELSNSLFAQWTGYNKLWYKNYVDSYLVEETPSVVIPDQYLQTLANIENFTIDGTDFFTVSKYSNTDVWRDRYNASYCIPVDTYNNGHTSFYGGNDSASRVASLSPLTININGSDSSGYVVTGNIININSIFYGTRAIYYLRFAGNGFASFSDAQIQNVSWFPQTFSTLGQALGFIDARFKHCAIKVNGESWADPFGSSAPANPVIPDFKDIININTDDPAYDIVVPVDGVPAWFDLTSLFDAIKLAIIDAKNASSDTDGVLNIDLALDNDLVIDDTGTVVDTKDESIDDVLDTPSEIDKTKDYPVIPLYTPPVQNAFKGTSILAELIYGTETVLPEELILTFWGIVFVIFILGLLKILHK